MMLNDSGRMVHHWYRELENKFPHIQCGPFILMPNHAHFIIVIVGADLCVRPCFGCIPNPVVDAGASLPRIVQWFKTMTTNSYIHGITNHGWLPFQGKLWQRNYFEHIIRNRRESEQLRFYIRTNPERWHEDPLYTPLSEHE